jgi:hypothetical protein
MDLIPPTLVDHLDAPHSYYVSHGGILYGIRKMRLVSANGLANG